MLAMQRPAIDSVARSTLIRARTADWRTHMPKRIRAQEAMASPPTITYTTTNPLDAAVTAGTAVAIAAMVMNGTSGEPVSVNPLFRYRKGGGPVIAGNTYPLWEAVRFTNVNYGSSTSANRVGIPLMTDAPRVVLQLLALDGQITAKVNGQYVSLTPQAVLGTDGTRYYDLNFGSSELREIEFIAYGNLRFGAIYLSSTATVMTAPPRGPRMIVMGDSFVQDTGATNILKSMIPYMADCLGWDDVWPDGVGSTGFVAGPAPLPKYRDRIATDVIPFTPDIVMLWMSLNDLGQTPAALVAEATLLIDALRASLPNVEIIVAGPGVAKGGGFTAPNVHNQASAMAALCAAKECKFINLVEQAVADDTPLLSTTLAASAAANATSISVTRRFAPGSTVRFSDGTHAYIKTATGGGPYSCTIDKLANAQFSGATITQCGPNIWGGEGKVGSTTGFGNCDIVVGTDGAHPTDAGHVMIGTALAYGVMRVLGGAA